MADELTNLSNEELARRAILWASRGCPADEAVEQEAIRAELNERRGLTPPQLDALLAQTAETYMAQISANILATAAKEPSPFFTITVAYHPTGLQISSSMAPELVPVDQAERLRALTFEMFKAVTQVARDSGGAGANITVVETANQTPAEATALQDLADNWAEVIDLGAGEDH